ncbi:MAG: hypothetical protein HY043_08450 [Verrucomicrobia bacterium]|nr:hypothetical protein [Verrucomicrobiota bacterium]
MSRLTVISLAVLALSACQLWGQAEAQIRIHCLSVLFHPVPTNIQTVTYSLELGAVDASLGPPNGELFPNFSDSVGDFTSLRGYYRFTASNRQKPFADDFIVEIPPFVDLNGNGISDFFEIGQGVPTTTTGGLFEDTGIQGGSIQATWTRPANSANGIVQMSMKSSILKLDATFIIPFEILEYAGTFEYTPGNTTTEGSITFVRVSQPNLSLAGTVKFKKDAADLIDLLPGSWADAAGKAIPYQGYLSVSSQTALIQRLGSNYEGLIAFDDGTFSRTGPVFDLNRNIQPIVWDLSIADPNDFDANGIPDLSDSTLPPLRPRRPYLSLSRSSNRLLFSLLGQVGQSYQIEQSLDLVQANWTTVLSVQLTNETQVFLWPPPPANAFWRARIP